MNVTPFINRLYFARRAKAIENYKGHAEELQMQVLRYLLIAASNTEWGKEHRYADIHSYEDFAARVEIDRYILGPHGNGRVGNLRADIIALLQKRGQLGGLERVEFQRI